jgi:hypothetical protein
MRARGSATARRVRGGGRRRAQFRPGRGRSVLSGGRPRRMLGTGRARARLGAGRGRARRPHALLALLVLAVAVAAGFAIAVLLRDDPPRTPVASPVTPLRVASGHEIATGFAVGDGRVITVAHVVDGPVTVRGRRVRVLRMDRRNDLALLAAPGVRAGGPELRPSAPELHPGAPELRPGAPELRPGAPELRAGAPRVANAADGQHLRVVRLRGGRLSLLSVDVRRSIVAHVRVAGAGRAVVRPALELSAGVVAGVVARVVAGDSGAPVITDDGALAGVVFAASRNRADTAYAVDAKAVTELLRRR